MADGGAGDTMVVLLALCTGVPRVHPVRATGIDDLDVACRAEINLQIDVR
jgi:hypothetical protein